MQIKPIKTRKIEAEDDLFEILGESLSNLSNGDVLVISSKIIALCQGDVIKDDGTISKNEILKKEADYYLPDEYTMHGIPLSIKNNTIGSGIDLSNSNGYFVLWPRNLQETTNNIWGHLRDKFQIKDFGVVVTDSRFMPLRKGITGIALSWCGFEPLRNYIGEPDVFGKPLTVTKASIIDGISSAAVLNMGEGNEQAPLAIVSEISNIEFVDRTPTKEELEEMSVDKDDDVFGKILNSVMWIKGRSSR